MISHQTSKKVVGKCCVESQRIDFLLFSSQDFLTLASLFQSDVPPLHSNGNNGELSNAKEGLVQTGLCCCLFSCHRAWQSACCVAGVPAERLGSSALQSDGLHSRDMECAGSRTSDHLVPNSKTKSTGSRGELGCETVVLGCQTVALAAQGICCEAIGTGDTVAAHEQWWLQCLQLCRCRFRNLLSLFVVVVSRLVGLAAVAPVAAHAVLWGSTGGTNRNLHCRVQAFACGSNPSVQQTSVLRCVQPTSLRKEMVRR